MLTVKHLSIENKTKVSCINPNFTNFAAHDNHAARIRLE